jgi:hypothetical protein
VRAPEGIDDRESGDTAAGLRARPAGTASALPAATSKPDGVAAEPAANPARRTALALLVSAVFVAVLILNLCYPTPRGAADNGDFARVFRAFASNPLGFPRIPARTDPSYRRRFFREYHRYWKITRQPSGAQPTTSLLLYAPARYVRLGQPLRYFDLTLSTAYAAVLLGGILFLVLRRLRSTAAFVSLSSIALIMSDCQVSIYVNSFYQESGAWAFTLLALCLLHLLWERSTLLWVALFTGAIGLLACTKFAFTPSAVLVGISALAAWAFALPQDRARARAALLASAVLILCGAIYFDATRDDYGEDVSYNFVFAGILPELAPAERGRFLESLGFEAGDAALVGKCFYDPDSLAQTPRFEAILGNRLHVPALARAALDHPGALVRLLGSAFVQTGRYDVARESLLGTRSAASPPSRLPRIEPWSRFREVAFSGASAYAWTFGLCAVLLWHVLSRGARDERFLYGFSALGFWAGSVAQVPIAILGNGPMDLNKHLWFGNLLLDVALVLALTGGGLAAMRAVRERS